MPASDASLCGAAEDPRCRASRGVTGVQYELTGRKPDRRGDRDRELECIRAGWRTGTRRGCPTAPTRCRAWLPTAGVYSGTSRGVTITVINSPPSTDLVLPSIGATVSGTQNLDAGASSGVTRSSTNSPGKALNDDVIATACRVSSAAGELELDCGAQRHLHTTKRGFLWRGVSGTSPGVTNIVAN